jgi:hypothetical protein
MRKICSTTWTGEGEITASFTSFGVVAAAATLSVVILMLATAKWFIVCRSRQKSDGAATLQLLLSETTRHFNEHKGSVLLTVLVAGRVAATGGRKP